MRYSDGRIMLKQSPDSFEAIAHTIANGDPPK
jgi:hypothetical protein